VADNRENRSLQTITPAHEAVARDGARHGLEAFTDINYVCRDRS